MRSFLQTLALMVLIGLRQWDKVLELLVILRQASTAAFLLEALREAALLDKFSDLSLVEAIYTEYAKELHSFGATEAALKFCDLGGSVGANFRKEMQLLDEA